jgi:hypothetical protein
MPLQLGAASIDTSQNSILVARVRVRNTVSVSPLEQPRLSYLVLTSQGKDRYYEEPALFSPERGNDYFASMDVAPGKAALNSINFVDRLLFSRVWAPLGYEIDVPNNKVIYLGSIDVALVRRTSKLPYTGTGVFSETTAFSQRTER